MYKFLFLAFFLFFIGCSEKQQDLSKLRAITLHNKIYDAIKYDNLDKADDYFISMQTQHPTSPFIKIDLLNLYIAHLKNEDYMLANFYLEQLEKKATSVDDIKWIEYQKIKVLFLQNHNAYTNQKLILNIISKCNNYLEKYPNSPYKYQVNTILAKAQLTKEFLNDNIKKLYKRLGKEKAANSIKTEIPKDAIAPKIPWYKKIFYW